MTTKGPQNTSTGLSPVWALTEELREIAEVDTGIIEELVSLFLDDSAVRLQTLTSACALHDFKIIRAQAHSLKGSSLQMGAGGLASLSAALELSERPEPEPCGLMLRAIGDEFILVRHAMEEYLVNTKMSCVPPEVPAEVAFK